MGYKIQFLCMFILLGCMGVSPLMGQQQISSTQQQIMGAVSAAPDSLQAEAKVLGYNADTTLATLRNGSNNLVCLADDPREPEFHVACYHKGLESFMARGRELKGEGMSRKEVDLIRRSEIKSGKLSMPEKPMALYSLSGSKDAVNYKDETIEDVSALYVIYIPFATESSTGLPGKPIGSGVPWLMEPGTPWAHIMVSGGEKISKKIKVDH